jgi:hypothetical protein
MKYSDFTTGGASSGLFRVLSCASTIPTPYSPRTLRMRCSDSEVFPQPAKYWRELRQRTDQAQRAFAEATHAQAPLAKIVPSTIRRSRASASGMTQRCSARPDDARDQRAQWEDSLRRQQGQITAERAASAYVAGSNRDDRALPGLIPLTLRERPSARQFSGLSSRGLRLRIWNGGSSAAPYPTEVTSAELHALRAHERLSTRRWDRCHLTSSILETL